MSSPHRLDAVFFRTTNGNEPVREWLKGLTKEHRKAIGEDIAYVQFKWPIGKPRVDHLRGAVWEVRSSVGDRIARIRRSRRKDGAASRIHQEDATNVK